jgi:striatin 1/3/4
LPHGNHDPYAPHDGSSARAVLVGHTDAVWGVCLLPPKADSKDDQETVLVSIGADSAIKVWEAKSDSSQWSLRTSFGYHGSDNDQEKSSPPQPVPTSVAVYQPDFTKVLVGFSNSVVKAFDVRTGAVALTFASEEDGVS